MKNQEQDFIGLPGPRSVQRKGLRLSTSDLVQIEPLRAGEMLPLEIRPSIEGVKLVSWAQRNKGWLASMLVKHEAILFRGFLIQSGAEVQQFLESISYGPLLDYDYASTPRRQVSGKLYTSTEYPADQVIPMHNEMSYTTSWPLRLC